MVVEVWHDDSEGKLAVDSIVCQVDSTVLVFGFSARVSYWLVAGSFWGKVVVAADTFACHFQLIVHVAWSLVPDRVQGLLPVLVSSVCSLGQTAKLPASHLARFR